MSNNTASVLEDVAATEEDTFESISSEDMLAKTKDYNKNVIEKRKIISANVKIIIKM